MEPLHAFRMLIWGPSKSGKTNILLRMTYELLQFDKVNLFSENLHQKTYQDFAANFEPFAGYKVIETRPSGDEIVPLEQLPVDNQKIVVFDDMVCESNQNSIINYSINGRHRKYSVFYLTQTLTTRCPKTSETSAAIFVF